MCILFIKTNRFHKYIEHTITHYAIETNTKTNISKYPLVNDVLCGRGDRGGRSFEHVGNKRFHKLVLDNKEHYAMSHGQEKNSKKYH